MQSTTTTKDGNWGLRAWHPKLLLETNAKKNNGSKHSSSSAMIQRQTGNRVVISIAWWKANQMESSFWYCKRVGENQDVASGASCDSCHFISWRLSQPVRKKRLDWKAPLGVTACPKLNPDALVFFFAFYIFTFPTTLLRYDLNTVPFTHFKYISSVQFHDFQWI